MGIRRSHALFAEIHQRLGHSRPRGCEGDECERATPQPSRREEVVNISPTSSEERALARVSKDAASPLRCVHPSRRLLRSSSDEVSILHRRAFARSLVAMTVSSARSSKRLTEKFRSTQPISPRQFDRFGNAIRNPVTMSVFSCAHAERVWWDVERQGVVAGVTKGFRQLPAASTAIAHRANPRRRRIAGMRGVGCKARDQTQPTLLLQTKLTHSGCHRNRIDIGNPLAARTSPDCAVSATERMRGRLGVMIGWTSTMMPPTPSPAGLPRSGQGRPCVRGGKERTLERPAQMGCG